MDVDEYRLRGKELIDWIADYITTLRDNDVTPKVEPGFMTQAMTSEVPFVGENWNDVMREIEQSVVPGMTHWQSPHMHAYYPALNSFPSLLGGMMSSAFNSLAFTWASSPSSTELEMVVTDWLGRMLQLPDKFLHSGGGHDKNNSSENTFDEEELVFETHGRNKSDGSLLEQIGDQEKEKSISAKEGKTADKCKSVCTAEVIQEELVFETHGRDKSDGSLMAQMRDQEKERSISAKKGKTADMCKCVFAAEVVHSDRNDLQASKSKDLNSSLENTPPVNGSDKSTCSSDSVPILGNSERCLVGEDDSSGQCDKSFCVTDACAGFTYSSVGFTDASVGGSDQCDSQQCSKKCVGEAVNIESQASCVNVRPGDKCSLISVGDDAECSLIEKAKFASPGSADVKKKLYRVNSVLDDVGFVRRFSEGLAGGGVLQTTTSESTLIAMLVARNEFFKKFENETKIQTLGRMVALCSDQAHSSVLKASRIALVDLKFVPSDENHSMTGTQLQFVVEESIANNKLPFFVCATLGTTGCCAFDKLYEIGKICVKYGIWLHVDAAYAGTAFICPEFRPLLDGIEYANSFVFNPSKWMMVHFDCTAMWVSDQDAITEMFNVSPIYLKHRHMGQCVDYMNWQLSLSKSFRALKLFCVLKCFGVSKLQTHIRRSVELAKQFEEQIQQIFGIKIEAIRYLGLVVFSLKSDNVLTEKLMNELNNTHKLYVVSAVLKDVLVIRYVVTSQYTTTEDISRDVKLIEKVSQQIMKNIA